MELYSELITNTIELMSNNRSAHSPDLQLRVLNTITSTSLLGIILEENDDSFLVALPCKLVEFNGTDRKAVQLYMPVPFVRIQKSAVILSLPMFGEFEIFYIKWLLDVGKDMYKELFTEEYVKRLENRFKKIKESMDETKEKLESIAGEGSQEDSRPFLITPPGKTKH